MSFLTSSSLAGGFVRAPYHHARRLLSDSDYRHIAWLRMRHGLTPRYREKTIRAFGTTYRVPDVASFLSTLDEVYGNGIYHFATDNPEPLVVDIGANVGVSVNYFLRMHPAVRVIAYEADPAIFGCLRDNVATDSGRVELVNSAVWDDNTLLRFAQEGADGGRVVESAGIEVPATDIRDILADRHIDLLKMDIEGAEERVLPACAGRLDGVRRIFVEYHSPVAGRQQLDSIIALLGAAGFRLHVQSVATSPRPFLERTVRGAFDMQLNIFGWKDAE